MKPHAICLALACALLAGCATPAASPPESIVGAAAATPEIERSFEWNGQFGRGAVACTPAACVVSPLHEDTRLGEWVHLWSSGRELSATLTWRAETPVMEELRFAVDVSTDGAVTRLAEVQGTSPLVLQVSETFGAAGARLGLSVSHVPVSEEVGAHAWPTTQPFQVAGSFWANAAPEGGPGS